jgi:hypothetical protein
MQIECSPLIESNDRTPIRAGRLAPVEPELNSRRKSEVRCRRSQRKEHRRKLMHRLRGSRGCYVRLYYRPIKIEAPGAPGLWRFQCVPRFLCELFSLFCRTFPSLVCAYSLKSAASIGAGRRMAWQLCYHNVALHRCRQNNYPAPLSLHDPHDRFATGHLATAIVLSLGFARPSTRSSDNKLGGLTTA